MSASQKPPDSEDRRQHLGFLQAVITRMSAASTTTKGWLLPVVTAAYGFSLAKHVGAIALLGIGATAVFAIIDANYLNQERSFRRLYDAVARGNNIPMFSMDHSLAAPANAKPFSTGRRRWLAPWYIARGWIPGFEIWSSWAIAPLYLPLIIIGATVFFAE